MIPDVIFRVFSAVVQKISDFKSDSELRLRSAKGKNASQDLCLQEKNNLSKPDGVNKLSVFYCMDLKIVPVCDNGIPILFD